jgi:hypothetical protein
MPFYLYHHIRHLTPILPLSPPQSLYLDPLHHINLNHLEVFHIGFLRLRGHDIFEGHGSLLGLKILRIGLESYLVGS